MIINSALADILDRDAGATESDLLLAALVDHGAFVPVRENGSVLFFRDDAGNPALPGYVSESCVEVRLAEAAGSVHCDVMRLLDIAGDTEAGRLMLFSDHGSATVPLPLLVRTLRRRGRQSQGERLRLTWSTHPAAVALRDALLRRVREFAAVRTVWISHARWLDTGMETLLLHVAVDEDLPSPTAHRMMEVLLAEEVTLGDGDPKVGMIAVNTAAHADAIADLERMGLDTVRHDRETGRVEVVSQEYDDPQVADAARRALAEEQPGAGSEAERPRRWWRRG
ncbi:hypothetical protein [Kitasatospora paracochleata]|uniref:Uncharacterized protein n=1 Tax=Kitasatospora paracochleata TaxID=58354 RepID=A0ABT1J3G6_9ACTN|nr:hypothetical protein [Kitasatospora paracochleata]MCP2311962.1 hypothetical protein [Kitasatospora paracochleata]